MSRDSGGVPKNRFFSPNKAARATSIVALGMRFSGIPACDTRTKDHMLLGPNGKDSDIGNHPYGSPSDAARGSASLHRLSQPKSARPSASVIGSYTPYLYQRNHFP